MIVLLSQVLGEATTSLVMDWLHHLGAPHLRLNGEELNEGLPFAAELEGSEVRFEVDYGGGTVLRGHEARAAWLRRWHTFQNLEQLRAPGTPEPGPSMYTYLSRELGSLSAVVEEALDGAAWLTRGGEMSVGKFHVLRQAARVGLEVPPTLVTNQRAQLERFMARHGRVVCKPMREAVTFLADGRAWASFTAEVTPELAGRLPGTFFPTLLQQRVEKAYELRVFYLAGRCWAMAMFSQGDPQTQADFRNYNHERPNRCVPFQLPDEIEARCGALMRALGLATGSLDLIRAADGRYVFLEVNPVGQFGMVSDPCNYQLEREVAEYLIGLADGTA